MTMGYEYHTNLRPADFTDIEIDHIKAEFQRLLDVYGGKGDTQHSWLYAEPESCSCVASDHNDSCWERIMERYEKMVAKAEAYKKRYPSILEGMRT